MTDEKRAATDPFMDEVRARRKLLMEQHGNDLSSLCKSIERLQREHPEKVKDRRRTTSAGG
ncbi:MAG: hypothetical protein HYR85_19105 [Planctomycetes bacterium]|nr:hypothetical protein [Planctomycetota bacterium]MBI3845442.1 hypothetical protein [Planctomycetota bacterium]